MKENSISEFYILIQISYIILIFVGDRCYILTPIKQTDQMSSQKQTNTETDGGIQRNWIYSVSEKPRVGEENNITYVLPVKHQGCEFCPERDC